jgi:hypothetical protein
VDADDYLDVDDGQPAIAACELVALGFGDGNLDRVPARIRSPDEDLRRLAIRALGPIRDRKRSELASLWAHDPAFGARIADLPSRLTDAGD